MSSGFDCFVELFHTTLQLHSMTKSQKDEHAKLKSEDVGLQQFLSQMCQNTVMIEQVCSCKYKTFKTENPVPRIHHANICYYNFVEVHHPCVTNSYCNFVIEQSFLTMIDCLINMAILLPAHTMDEHTLLDLSGLVQISPNTILHCVAWTTLSTPQGRTHTHCMPHCSPLYHECS